jgi:glycosyltransferase involved in cell wall biosynthesis
MRPRDHSTDLGTDGRPVVLGAGRLAAQKGFDTLIAAAARWQDRRPEPLLAIAGTGPLAGDLARQARELGVAVRFLGWQDDLTGLLAAADVFALPSQWEGQPLILQEALCAGRPIVATDVGGVRELTGDDAALLVSPGDPAAFAATVLSVLDDAELAAKLGRAAARRAAALPTETEAIEAALALYQRLSP